MIGQLHGKILSKSFVDCQILCGGVGYEVLIPLSTFDRLPAEGSDSVLFIHTQVREDAITLFGFAEAKEKELFRMLINVSGIGGKLALNILSSMPAENFYSAIASGDTKVLSKISGIGKKTAERLVLELKDKVNKLGGVLPITVAGTGNFGQAANDAALALETLGFKRDAVEKALRQVAGDNAGTELPSEEILRKALMILNF